MQAFATAVSHDLRTPLTVARNYQSILRRRYADRLDDEGRRVLGRIEDSLSKMSGVMEDMLRLTVAASAELDPRDVALGEITAEVAVMMHEREPNLDMALLVDELVLAWGDDRMLRVLMETLINVAWRSSREGTVEFASEMRGDDTVYYVRGGGALPSLDSNRLDMAIAACIVRRHGGRAWTEHEEHGARFCFTLADE